jgi:hypothetical protein
VLNANEFELKVRQVGDTQTTLPKAQKQQGIA